MCIERGYHQGRPRTVVAKMAENCMKCSSAHPTHHQAPWSWDSKMPENSPFSRDFFNFFFLILVKNGFHVCVGGGGGV